MALASAAGDDLSLLEDLRASFVESLNSQLNLLTRARCDGNWQMAAERLKRLGASFHSGDLVSLAEEALEGAPGDPAVLRKLDQFAQRFSAVD